MTKLDGNKIAKSYREELKKDVEELKSRGINPTIAPVLVGDEPGAKVYYRTKKNLAQKLGIEYRGVKLDGDISRKNLLDQLRDLNQDPEVHGLFIELPLPEGLDIEELRTEINPKKDVDCINPVNSGKLLLVRGSYEGLKNDPKVLLPATPYAVMEILKYSGIDLTGKEFLVVGGGTVGLPLSLLASHDAHSTVSVVRSRVENLPEKTRRADILCSSVGRKNFITEDMVSEGTVVVDVGINSTESGITGDVDYENVKDKAAAITPVPGGVGPVTTTLIMANTVKAARLLQG